MLKIKVDYLREAERFKSANFDGRKCTYIGTTQAQFAPVDLYLNQAASSVYAKYSDRHNDYQAASLNSVETRGHIAELFVAARVVQEMMEEGMDRNKLLVQQIEHEVRETCLLQIPERERYKISIGRGNHGWRYLGSTSVRKSRADLYFSASTWGHVELFWIQYSDNDGNEWAAYLGLARAEICLALQVIQLEQAPLSLLGKAGHFLKNH